MPQQRTDFKKLRSQISLQYGIDLDETTLIVLSILTGELKRQHTIMNQKQEEMAAQIKLSKKALQVDAVHPRWQAFWHGMGQWGLGLCLAVVLACVLLSIDWIKERKEKQLLHKELELCKAAYYQKITEQGAKAATKTGNNKKK